jgi:DNA-binding transcriptional regulator YdaS (Cro superfamily)
MKPSQAVEHFGTQQNVADAIGITQSAVGQWFRKGRIPPMSQLRLEAVTHGVLVADKSIPRGHTKYRPRKQQHHD